jgi:hypothetical protein
VHLEIKSSGRKQGTEDGRRHNVVVSYRMSDRHSHIPRTSRTERWLSNLSWRFVRDETDRQPPRPLIRPRLQGRFGWTIGMVTTMTLLLSGGRTLDIDWSHGTCLTCLIEKRAETHETRLWTTLPGGPSIILFSAPRAE